MPNEQFPVDEADLSEEDQLILSKLWFSPEDFIFPYCCGDGLDQFRVDDHPVRKCSQCGTVIPTSSA